MEVERWFNRPVLLLGAVLTLIVASIFVELGFHTSAWQIVWGIGLVAVGFGVPLAFLSYVFGGSERSSHQEAAPGRPDRVLTITDVAGGFSVHPVYRMELVSGSGWSVRHWSTGVRWKSSRAVWAGPDRITVTGGSTVTVFDVLPDGSLSAPRDEPLPPKQ